MDSTVYIFAVLSVLCTLGIAWVIRYLIRRRQAELQAECVITVAVPVVGAVPVQPHGPTPPYPVQQTIMPQPMQGHQMPAVPIGFSAYPQTPYPPPGTRDFNPPAAYPPYPGYPPHASAGPAQQNPPTYDEATMGSQVYPKQSPYNPTYK